MFDVDDDESAPETVPTPGTAQLTVVDQNFTLFSTTEWTIVATVGQHELGRSTTIDRSHTEPFIKRWTRQLIRSNKERLRRLGVDVIKTYVENGGVPEDLQDTYD